MILTCTKCKQEKDENEFYNNRTMPRGKTYWCKVCSNYQSNIVGKETKARWAAKTHQKVRRTQTEKYLWKMAKSRAKDRNLEFTITPEDIIIPSHCPYLGVPFSFEDRDRAPSLDRIDSSLGYIKDNIQVISWRANVLKSDATIDQMIKFARGILEVHAKEGT